jgi:5'-nucleotidase
VRYYLILIFCFSLPCQAAQSLRILLTNDDGYESIGINAMRKALTQAGHDVYTIAPATQQSGASASITARGVHVTAHQDQIWSVHGRPADAVRVGLGYIMFDTPPDLVISGANFSQNVGHDVNISGTVGAAITAFRLGVPAIALSVEVILEERPKGFPSSVGAFDGAGRLLVRLLENLDLDDLTAVLNVNYPARLPLDVKGVRWSMLSDHSIIGKRYNRRPDGKFAPELLSPYKHARKNDAESLADGYVTLTFLDGIMSVKTHRNQKYLDKYLLDRDYEPANVPIRQREPEKKPEPVQVPAEPEDNQVVEFQEATPVPPMNKLEEVETVTPPESTATAAPLPEVPKAILKNEPTESSMAPEAEKKKKKPDSWLRRIFKPKSW